MLVAQAATQDLGSSSGLLMFILGGGLIALLVSAYRFFVNLRTTERGMARQRIQDANRGERAAQYEASLWQGYAADLEYVIRTELGSARVPAKSEELRKMLTEQSSSGPASGTLPPVQWDPPATDTGGRPGA